LIDEQDPACHTDGNQNNSNSYDPNRSESGGGVTPSITSGPTTSPTNSPTTIPSGSTSLQLSVFLHGIGQGGDSANPQSGGNANPLHPQRSAKVEVYNSQNQLVLTKDTGIAFDTSSGSFKATIDMGTNLTTGVYNVKVQTEQFLKTLVPGIQNIAAGTQVQLPPTVMVNGDINLDNTVNILDYNILSGCYSDFLPAVSCTADNKVLADLDDDGNVNQFDYNLFLRELTNRIGQ
ncbi:MAG: dockerin type I domain-containing protein, partial [Minisyncoccia bacterium]